MMKKRIKILVTTLMVVTIFNIFQMYNMKSYAVKNNLPGLPGVDGPIIWGDDEDTGGSVSTGSTGMSDAADIADYWKPTESNTDSEFNNKVGVIAGLVKVVGTIASVITLAIIGIKFMLGSVEEKAQYKQTLIPWLIGAILLFGMTNIPMIIYNFSRGTFN